MNPNALNVGNREKLISVQRATKTTDDYGGETDVWADLEQAWARVLFGRAVEQRQAAQQQADQTATFEVVPTAVLLGAQLTDRIMYDGDPWGITEIAPLDRQTLRFTGVRSK